MIEFPELVDTVTAARALNKKPQALRMRIHRGQVMKGIYNRSLRRWNLTEIRRRLEKDLDIFVNGGKD